MRLNECVNRRQEDRFFAFSFVFSLLYSFEYYSFGTFCSNDG